MPGPQARGDSGPGCSPSAFTGESRHTPCHACGPHGAPPPREGGRARGTRFRGKVNRGERSAPDRRQPMDLNPLPLGGFTRCFTLFPKFFSSFDRPTCPLSDSGHCLALGGACLPLGAVVPNSPTRGSDTGVVSCSGRHRTGGFPLFHLGWAFTIAGVPFQAACLPPSGACGSSPVRPRPHNVTGLPVSHRPRLQGWALAGSLAATGAIAVAFSSCP